MKKKNLFVIGLNEFNRARLEGLQHADEYEFHELLSYEEVTEQDEYPVIDLLQKAENIIAGFQGTVDGIIGYMDFPVSTMVPVLCERFGLRSASVNAFIKCEHKYWSRVEQQQSIPDHIPRFCLFDPFSDNPADEITLAYPFWIKPVKSFGSHLGFMIRNKSDLDEAIPVIREQVVRISRPFDRLLDYLQPAMPDHVREVKAHYFLAEELIGGLQCTLEGCMHDGELHVHGIVDSIRYPGRSAFFRYQYPSVLPQRIRREMTRICKTFLNHITFNNSAFNMEFFWNRRMNKIYMLEVNTRIAQHHSELFQKVDGVSNHQVPVDLASGRIPAIPDGKGRHKLAAACFYREFRDAFVEQVPGDRELERIRNSVPGTIIQVDVSPGMYLSDLPEQDSYSYICALIYLGADNRKELLSRYNLCLGELSFRMSPVGNNPDRTSDSTKN
ncbi:ATP-grasp domain-containing protein [Natronogracilivirga saccharolytica]|uniref:ATP-grasp domain-containing protein n=1 Tax=Natronogracilivirga saccharolytica TaxID=2812953 RepID=A0A8J7SAG5_9BACT|nr:ATP-grasp domain-containing protein [Natronogracilivirga saccharolytica]MBP3193016.1 ATP-grasp domain-containing protein [Natronogracilivirga saccharolytica]